MRIKIEDGETKLEPSCSSATTLSCVTTRDGNVMVSVPKRGAFVIDVTVERMRAPLPDGAQWDGDRIIRYKNVLYGVLPDGCVWGRFQPSGLSAPVPPWALEAFIAEWLLKTERDEPTEDDDENAGSSELPSLRHLAPTQAEALEGIHDIVASMREDLQQLSSAILDRCPEPKPSRAEGEEHPREPKESESLVLDWAWNKDIPPPVELPKGMRWCYDPHVDANSWNIMSGIISIGYVRRRLGEEYLVMLRRAHGRFTLESLRHKSIDACRELARLVATATDLYREPKPARVEREEQPPAPEPAEEWTWNREVPPPVELPSAEMWWRYESVLGVWHVMSGKWPPVSLGYVRRDPSGHFFAFYRDKYAIHANATDAFRELARVLRDRGRKWPEPCHEPGDELPSK